MKIFAITGTFHGSIIESRTEGGARKAFHLLYGGESIIHVRLMLSEPYSVCCLGKITEYK